MKHVSLLLLALTVVLTSCATGPESRAQRHPEMYAKLKDNERGLVMQGRVKEGMSRDAVFLAWGRPDVVRTGSRSGKGKETWGYFSSAPVHSVGMGWGGGYSYHPFYSDFGVHPRYGYAYGPTWGYSTHVDFVPYISKTVEFSGDRVVAWEQGSR